jgi:hypothetical protein
VSFLLVLGAARLSRLFTLSEVGCPEITLTT